LMLFFSKFSGLFLCLLTVPRAACCNCFTICSPLHTHLACMFNCLTLICLPLPPFISFPLLPLFLAYIYSAANLVRDKGS
jgi:hypothetical protein